MKTLLLSVGLLVTLCGCAEWVTPVDCRDLTDVQCDEANYERQVQWQLRRERMGRALGNGVQDYGNSMRGQTTTCTNVGGFVSCTTR